MNGPKLSHGCIGGRNLCAHICQNMEHKKRILQQGLRVLLAVYLIFTFYMTVVSRVSSGKDLIRTEWLARN